MTNHNCRHCDGGDIDYGGAGHTLGCTCCSCYGMACVPSVTLHANHLRTRDGHDHAQLSVATMAACDICADYSERFHGELESSSRAVVNAAFDGAHHADGMRNAFGFAR